MLPLSDKAKSALKYSQTITQAFEVCKPFTRNVLYDSRVSKGLLDGEVSVSNDSTRRRLSFRLTDPTGAFIPSKGSDIFTTYGNEARAFRGLRYSDGTTEEWPLGVFEMADLEFDDSGTGLTISGTAYDRSHTVSARKLTKDYDIAEGTNYGTAIQELLRQSVPQLEFNFIGLSYTTPATVVKTGDDVWSKAQDMAAACGCELFFDPVGVCTLRAVPDYSIADPVWTYAEGAEAMILYLNKRLTNNEAFNYYIYTGEQTSNGVQVRGDAFDDNPSSPTYYKGQYGVRPAPVESSRLVTSTAQAAAAARGALQGSIGYAERVHFNSLVVAAHEVGDVVQITRGKSKVDNRYVLDAFSIPLTHNRAMDAVTRVRQSTS